MTKLEQILTIIAENQLAELHFLASTEYSEYNESTRIKSFVTHQRDVLKSLTEDNDNDPEATINASSGLHGNSGCP